MRLSTKGRYAVTAMMDLVLHGDQGPVTLAQISSAQGISLSYLEQLFAALRREGLVSGVRGPGGGYRLAKHANAITVAHVIAAVDEGASRAQGGSDEAGSEAGSTHALWMDLSQQIYDFLDGITLEQLAGQPERRASLDLGGEPARQSGSMA